MKMILRRRISHKTLVYPLAAIIVLVLLTPYYWLMISSVMPRSEQLLWPPHWFPTNPSLHAYYEVLETPRFLQAFKNSVIITASTTIAVLIASSLAAYGLARIPFGNKKILLTVLLLIGGVPFWICCIPYFIMFRNIGLIDTHFAIILLLTVRLLPITSWVLFGFFKSIPVEIEESARVDGCSRIGAIFRIFVPLAAPGLISVGAYAFINSWNNFIVAAIIGGSNTIVLPVFVLNLMGSFSFEFRIDQLLASSIMVTILPILIIAVTQKYFIKGLFTGAVKA